MNDWLFAPIGELTGFDELAEAARRPGCIALNGLSDTQRLSVLAALAERLKRPLLLIATTDQAARRASDDLTALLGECAYFPAREASFQAVTTQSRDLARARLEALGKLRAGARALVAPVDALMYPLMPPERFSEAVITLKEGDRFDPDALIAALVNAGYAREDVVEQRGQCAKRGGIVDVFPVGRAGAIRLEFFDDELDSLREFDTLSQRSVGEIKRAVLLPASETLLSPEERARACARLEAAVDSAEKLELAPGARRAIEEEFDLPPWEDFEREAEKDELPELDNMAAPDDGVLRAKPASEIRASFARHLDALRGDAAPSGEEMLFPYLYEKPASLADYARGALVAFDEPDRLKERCENIALEFFEQYKTALERRAALPEQAELLTPFERITASFAGERTLAVAPFERNIDCLTPRKSFFFDGAGGAGYQGNIREAARDVNRLKKEGWRVALLSGGAARGARLMRTLDELKCVAEFLEKPPEALAAGRAVILPISIAHGFSYPGVKLAVFSESDLFGAGRQKSRLRFDAGEKLSAFTDLNVGDFVVHESYGVGQYLGTVRLQSDGAWGDYLDIRYQGTDKLYVPTDQLDRVQKYIGSENSPPRLNRLSGPEWQKQKARVKAGIEEIAGDLLKLYAKRQSVSGHAFAPDTPWQRQFEEAFAYDETPDQLAAIEEIKRDMQKSTAMDRLLCGDVGYGTTVVALRAIYKALMDGKPGALLAPTTILVQQHLSTMRSRFSGYPIRVESLSRFKTAAEQKLTVEALKKGEVDVVVGTHRMLAKDVSFKDLGLLVVDEEQRFGVKHKEAIKELKQNVDVLTLSATPIPRTLHMSMVGIRDMSLLRTPPEERYPVQTYVAEYSDVLVRDAILRELARGGQAYILYNRVASIEKFYDRVKQLVPEARVAVGHGQMREHMLEDVMLDFYDGKFDVLLCTTIIEAGLDVPTANTLIVIDADRFGLAQLYQLRGRVGRSNRLAYAYLTVKPGKALSETADKRLEAIREFTEFGSGFRVAMRDMEIRGTGNLLGASQSGHMASVGYDLYVKMIEETVREMRGDVAQGDITTRVELRMDAYLPGDYVKGDKLRIDVYKKIAGINGRAAREDLLEELIDRFGDPSRPVMNLIDIAHLKGLLSRVGVENVSIKQGALLMRFSPKAALDPSKLIGALGKDKRITLAATKPPSLSFADGNRAADDLVRRAIPALEKLVDEVSPLENE